MMSGQTAHRVNMIALQRAGFIGLMMLAFLMANTRALAADPPPGGSQFSGAPGFDFDGDGESDLLITEVIESPDDPTIRQIQVFTSSTSDAGFVLSRGEADDLYGASVSTAGDINFDGFDDIVVGAAGSNLGGVRGGMAYLHSGFDGELIGAFLGRPGTSTGRSVSGAGDFNGDGWDDVALGSFGVRDDGLHAGIVTVISGFDQQVIGRVVGGFDQNGADLFGHAIAGLGDLDGDGFAEIAVSSPFDVIDGSTAHGRVFVFAGLPSENGLIDQIAVDAIATFINEDDRVEHFGLVVGPALDMNADGLNEVLVFSGRIEPDGTRRIRIDAFDTLTGQLVSTATVDPISHPGDTDLDNDVDTDDLNTVLAGIGDQVPSGRPYSGDTTGDGEVDTEDLLNVVEQYGIDSVVLEYTDQPNLFILARTRLHEILRDEIANGGDGGPLGGGDPPVPDPQLLGCKPPDAPPDCFGGVPAPDDNPTPPGFFAPPIRPIFIAGPYIPPPPPPFCDEPSPCECDELPFHECYCDDDGDGLPNFWEDDDCDGVPNLVDPTTAANGCFILDTWCLGPNADSDDDGDGIRNQDEMLHPCNTRVFTPDPETHLELTALTIFPGDSEFISVNPDCGCESTEFRLTITDTTIAQFWVGDTIATELQISREPIVAELVGLSPGSTTIELRRDTADGELCATFPIHCGGSIFVQFDRCPTFSVAGIISEGPGFPGSTTNQAGSEFWIGNAPLASGHAFSRHEIRDDLAEVLDGLPDVNSTLRVILQDALGEPKPGKSVRVVPRDGKVYPSDGSALRSANRDGFAEYSIAADAAKIYESWVAHTTDPEHPYQFYTPPFSEWSIDSDQVGILVGRFAEVYYPESDDYLHREAIDDLFDDSGRHFGAEFWGNHFLLEGPEELHRAEHASVFTWSTGATGNLIAMNKRHFVLLLHYAFDATQFEFPEAPEQGTTYEVRLGGVLFAVGEYRDESAIDSSDGLSPSEINTLIEWASTAAVPARLSMASPFNAPLDQPPGNPAAGIDPATAVTLVGMVGWNFVPFLPDALDLGIELLWKPVFLGEAPDGETVGLALLGILADGGYLAGPVGILTNTAVAGLKVSKRAADLVDPRLMEGVAEAAGTVRDGSRAVANYVDKLPRPPGMDAAAHTLNQGERFGEQAARIVGSPIGIPVEKASQALHLMGSKARTRMFSDDAAEGIAGHIAKRGDDAVESLRELHDAVRLANDPAGLGGQFADEAYESIGGSIGRAYKDVGDDAIQRVDEAIAAATRTLDPAYRNTIESFIGPDHAIKSMEEFEAVRFMRAEDLLPEQVVAMRMIRESLGGISQGAQVAKVVPLTGEFNAIELIETGNANLAGSFARAGDLNGAQSTPQLIDRLRIDSPPHHFQSNSPHAIIETTANTDIAANAKIPRTGDFNSGHALDDPIPPSFSYPYTGNGFTASRDGRLVPEFRTAGGGPVKMTVGTNAQGQPITTLKFRFDDGSPYPQTIGGQTASDWKLVPDLDPDSLTGFKWEPIP